MSVVPFRKSEQAAPTAEELFQDARATLLRRFSAWLATRPPTADVEAEVDGTVSAIRQLHALHDGSRHV